MATLTVTDITTAGETRALGVAAAGGDQFANDGRTIFEASNASGGSITITFVSQRACDQGTVHNTAVAVGAGVTKRIGPFIPSRYNDASGYVQVTYSGVTSLTVGVASV
jgi:hypothetical protein